VVTAQRWPRLERKGKRVGEKAGIYSKINPELSGIIMEINDLRRLAGSSLPQGPARSLTTLLRQGYGGQDGGLDGGPGWPRTTIYAPMSKNRRLSASQTPYYHCLTGMQQHKFNIILRVKLLIIIECYGVTDQTGGTAGLEVKTRFAPPGGRCLPPDPRAANGRLRIGEHTRPRRWHSQIL